MLNTIGKIDYHGNAYGGMRDGVGYSLQSNDDEIQNAYKIAALYDNAVSDEKGSDEVNIQINFSTTELTRDFVKSLVFSRNDNDLTIETTFVFESGAWFLKVKRHLNTQWRNA
jgi:hypothetical protein